MGPTGADLVKEARKRAGLSQRRLGELAGTTQSAVARWETGRSEPSFATVVRLLRLCGFVLDVHLEPYDDGLRDDWHQARQLVALDPDENHRELVSVVEWLAKGRRAYQDAVGA